MEEQIISLCPSSRKWPQNNLGYSQDPDNFLPPPATAQQSVSGESTWNSGRTSSHPLIIKPSLQFAGMENFSGVMQMYNCPHILPPLSPGPFRAFNISFGIAMIFYFWYFCRFSFISISPRKFDLEPKILSPMIFLVDTIFLKNFFFFLAPLLHRHNVFCVCALTPYFCTPPPRPEGRAAGAATDIPAAAAARVCAGAPGRHLRHRRRQAGGCHRQGTTPPSWSNLRRERDGDG